VARTTLGGDQLRVTHNAALVNRCGRPRARIAGKVRYRADAKKQAASRPFGHRVVLRQTAFRAASDAKPGIQELYGALARDEERNDLIFEHVRGFWLGSFVGWRCEEIIVARDPQHYPAPLLRSHPRSMRASLFRAPPPVFRMIEPAVAPSSFLATIGGDKMR
jgi:hypothetical protein